MLLSIPAPIYGWAGERASGRSPEQLPAGFGHLLHTSLGDLGEVAQVIAAAVKIPGAWQSTRTDTCTAR